MAWDSGHECLWSQVQVDPGQVERSHLILHATKICKSIQWVTLSMQQDWKCLIAKLWQAELLLQKRVFSDCLIDFVCPNSLLISAPTFLCGIRLSIEWWPMEPSTRTVSKGATDLSWSTSSPRWQKQQSVLLSQERTVLLPAEVQ